MRLGPAAPASGKVGRTDSTTTSGRLVPPCPHQTDQEYLPKREQRNRQCDAAGGRPQRCGPGPDRMTLVHIECGEERSKLSPGQEDADPDRPRSLERGQHGSGNQGKAQGQRKPVSPLPIRAHRIELGRLEEKWVRKDCQCEQRQRAACPL